MPDRTLMGMTQSELEEFLGEHGHPAFRAKQVRKWIFDHGVTDPSAMTNLPSNVRALLSSGCLPTALSLAAEQTSKDGTIKRLYGLQDGQQIEAVLMPYRDNRRTACISSQAGCAMGCTFCATGQMGFARHLSASEIFEQAATYAVLLKQRGERLSNVVLMGMGEPFHNYDNVLEAIRRITKELGIGQRHITVSTVGIAPKIRAFADEGLQITLAISLHAATDEARSPMLPVNRRYPIDELLEACRYYVEKTNRRITFEWALIAGKNDDRLTAHQLGRRLKGLLCHVNLIPLNPTSGFDGQPTGQPAASEFVATLAEYGVTATLRTRRGIDIDAGCGQLKATNQKRRT